MLASLASIATLMLSTLLMMAGFGLMQYMVPIRSLDEGWSTLVISITATGYTFGFTMSCIITPKLVQRVGHVRVFSALVTLLTVSILLCSLVVDWRAWVVFRGLAGFAIAGAYLIIESWLNERVTNDNRGAVFSVYMITCLVGSIGGQYLVPLGDPTGPELFILCGIIFSWPYSRRRCPRLSRRRRSPRHASISCGSIAALRSPSSARCCRVRFPAHGAVSEPSIRRISA